MNDQVRTNSKLLEENAFLKQKIQELEQSESECKLAEEALRESEERYRSLVEKANEAIYVAQDGMLKFVNRAGVEIAGYSEQEIISKPFIEFVHPDDRAMVGERYLKRLKGEGYESRYAFRFVTKNGGIKWLELSAALINFEGRPATLNLVTDITDRKLAEEELKKSEEKYRTIIESMEDGYHEVDLKGNFTLFNESARKMIGYEQKDLLGMNYRQYADEENTSKIYQAYSRIYRTGEPVKNFEWQITRKDGEHRDIEVSISLIRNTEGHPTGFRGIVRDTTDRKRAEAELKSSLSLLSASLESTADGILIVDRNGKIARWNQKFADMWKIPEEVLASRDDEKAINHILKQLADPEQFVANVMKLYEQPEKSSFDQIEFADGRVFERFSQPQRIEDNLDGRVWSFRDITERKQAEAEKMKLEEQYRQAQKMEAIGQLAGGVAHDFNNMLNIILGYSQITLMKIEPSDPLNANLQEIMNAARRSADLVRQLLAFARKQTIAPKALDLNDTVAGMLNMLRKLIGEDIDLLWMPAANLRPVKMDPAQVDQILANLAVNARDSISGVGKITIETGNEEFDDSYCAKHAGFVPGHYVMLAVSDNGCGMDKETLEQIFDPFFTTKEIGKGTGMGLATVYGIVKQNNGFINVYSEPGKGATFKVYLPWHKDEGMAIDEPRTHAEPLTGTETVLLVEDNEALLKMGKKMLEELGYAVLTTGSPNEAIELAKQFAGDIQLVLTDVVMPEMSGRDLQRRLSALWPSLKFLFMSGYTANVIAHRGILDEGVHFLQKPFHMEVLATKVREALKRP